MERWGYCVVVNSSTATNGRPRVPTTTIAIVCLPFAGQAFDQTVLRGENALAYRSTVAASLPST